MKTIRWKPRRVCANIALFVESVLIVLFLGSKKIEKYISYDELLYHSFSISLTLFVLVVFIIYIVIVIQAKNKVYYVDMKNKICIKGDRKFKYTTYNKKQKLEQKIFMLIDIEFRNGCKKIIFKDVEQWVFDNLKELEGK